MYILLKIGAAYVLVSAIASLLYVIIELRRVAQNELRDRRQLPLTKHGSSLMAGKEWNGSDRPADRGVEGLRPGNKKAPPLRAGQDESWRIGQECHAARPTASMGARAVGASLLPPRAWAVGPPWEPAARLVGPSNRPPGTAFMMPAMCRLGWT